MHRISNACLLALTLVLGALAPACGGSGSGSPADKADGAVGSSTDGGLGNADAASGDLPTSCTGDCSALTLDVTISGTTRAAQRAFFGLSAPAQSDSGDWEIYIETGAGGDDACPTMDSPTPTFLLIIAGLALPSQVGQTDAGTATLVDFEGALLADTVFEEASANTVTWVAGDPCIACAEGSEPDRADRFVAIDISSTFTNGSASGRSYATHCDSLDHL